MSVANVGIGLITPMDLPLVQTYAEAARREIAQKAGPLPGRQNGESEPHQVLHSAAADLEKLSTAFDKKLQFVVDHHSKEVIVKVIDRETDKVIKELPPEELQRMHSRLRETIGFLFDELA